MLDKFKLTDKVAVITGAGRGVGKGIALCFAEAGANVVCASRTLEQSQATAELIKAKGRKSFAMSVDVRKAEQVDEMVKKTMETFGRIDVLVNNAGTNFFSPLLGLSQNGWEALIRENLTSAFLCAKAAGKIMVEQKKGNIINISSRAGTMGTENMGAYGAAKAGMQNMTETLAWELAPYNIRVNCLCLGPVLTEVNKEMLTKDVQRETSSLLIKRLGQPEDVGWFCVFLASEASSWLTGKIMQIDGGQRATFNQVF
jgi:7-alpha-hydroxysteroid dehydrogenase